MTKYLPTTAESEEPACTYIAVIHLIISDVLQDYVSMKDIMIARYKSSLIMRESHECWKCGNLAEYLR